MSELKLGPPRRKTDSKEQQDSEEKENPRRRRKASATRGMTGPLLAKLPGDMGDDSKPD
jgi:hypothetical protein